MLYVQNSVMTCCVFDTATGRDDDNYAGPQRLLPALRRPLCGYLSGPSRGDAYVRGTTRKLGVCARSLSHEQILFMACAFNAATGIHYARVQEEYRREISACLQSPHRSRMRQDRTALVRRGRPPACRTSRPAEETSSLGMKRGT